MMGKKKTMTNLLALCLVLSTILAAELWSPSQVITTHRMASEGDVIVKDGHRFVVVEYDRDGKTNTRVSISPPSANREEQKEEDEEEDKETTLFRNAKEKEKQTATYFPHVRQEISHPVVKSREETEEAGVHHHETAGEAICDALGKCRQKIATVVGRGKDRTADTVGETVPDAGVAAVGKAHDGKEKVARAARDVEETVADKAQYAKRKATEKAYDMEENVAHKTQYAKEKVAEKAHEMKEAAKDREREKAHELKERVKTAARGFGSAMAAVLSLKKVASVVGLTSIAAAFGTCVWVTFVSSYVLASVLGRQQFGVVQSKLYPIYFKATSAGILVGFLGHVLSRRRKLLIDATEMWQGVNLLSSLFMIEANKSFIEPRATKAMFERMKAEKEGGRGGGERRSEEEVRQKLEKLSERLNKLNTYSSWLNISTLMSLTWHFVYLGQRLCAAC